MKEIKGLTLTIRDQKHYSMGGDNIMGEAKGDGQPQKLQGEQTPMNNEQKIVDAGVQWREHLKDIGSPWESLHVDMRDLIMGRIKEGKGPFDVDESKQEKKEEVKLEEEKLEGAKKSLKKPTEDHSGHQDNKEKNGDSKEDESILEWGWKEKFTDEENQLIDRLMGESKERAKKLNLDWDKDLTHADKMKNAKDILKKVKEFREKKGQGGEKDVKKPEAQAGGGEPPYNNEDNKGKVDESSGNGNNGGNVNGNGNGGEGSAGKQPNSLPEPLNRIYEEMQRESVRLSGKNFSQEYIREQIARIHKLIDDNNFDKQGVVAAHNFIEALNKDIDKVFEAETSRGKIKLKEGDYRDSQIRSKIPDANEILEKIKQGKLGVNEYEKFLKQVSDLKPSADYTNEQRDALNMEKQTLRSLLSDVFMESLHPQSKDRIEKTLALKKAMQEGNYDEIEKIIMEEMDIDDPNTYASAIRDAVLDTMKNKEGNQLREKDHMIEFLLEYGVERILGMADAKPKEQYPQFNLYQQTNLDAVLQAARKYDEIRSNPDNGMFRYLAELMSKRQIMHELFRSMKERKTYVEYVSGYLRKSGFAFVEKNIVGAADVQIAYEKILGSAKSMKKSWLTDIDFEQADENMLTYLRSSNAKGNLQKDLLDENSGERGSRSLRDWEIKRAMFMGRSLSAACQRRITYGVLGDVPPNTDPDTLYKSLEFEFLARILAPTKVLPQRFFGWPMGKWYIKTLLTETKKRAEKDKKTFGYGDVVKSADGSEHRKGLYGQSDDSFAILDTSVTDPKSNSWRGRLLFLKQKDYQGYTLDGAKVSIGEYLEKMELQIQDEVRQSYRGKFDLQSKDERKRNLAEKDVDKIAKERFNEELRTNGIINQQRLFLGVLLKNKDANLDLENKTLLWKKAAHFIPSRMAAFFPEEARQYMCEVCGIDNIKENNEIITLRWKEMQQKIWDAEHLRVKNDAEILKRLKNENWVDIENSLGDLSSYYGRVGIDDLDAQVIQKLQALGESRAEELAKIKFAFTPFLDDVPKTDWENLTDEDFDRILINDQSAFEKGYGIITGLIADPVSKPEDAAKKFEEAYKEISSPLGQPDARKALLKHISTYVKLTEMNSDAKLFSGIMKLIRAPRSVIERYNFQAEIAHDEEAIGSFLKALSQKEVISDDLSEADEKHMTPYREMLSKHKVDKIAKLLRYARLIMLILGPVLGMEIIKSILPPDIAKQVSG